MISNFTRICDAIDADKRAQIGFEDDIDGGPRAPITFATFDNVKKDLGLCVCKLEALRSERDALKAENERLRNELKLCNRSRKWWKALAYEANAEKISCRAATIKQNEESALAASEIATFDKWSHVPGQCPMGCNAPEVAKKALGIEISAGWEKLPDEIE